MSYLLYGIPNCDTVKKVRADLDQCGIAYDFVDFKKNPPSKTLIQGWAKQIGELPVNKRGTTFRKIKADWEQGQKTEQLALLVENPSAIKRPILALEGEVLMLGHNPELIKKLKA